MENRRKKVLYDLDQVVVDKLLEVGLAEVLGLVLPLHWLVLVDVALLHLKISHFSFQSGSIPGKDPPTY